MATDDAPLPQCTNEQDGREEDVYQFVGDEDDAEGNDEKSYGDEWRVDAEGTLDLVALDTQQQREQDDAQQPGIGDQQVSGHDEEVLLDGSQRDAQNEGERHCRRGQRDAGTLLHKFLCAQALGHDIADEQEVNQRSEDGIEDDADEHAEDVARVPLGIVGGLVLLLDGARHKLPVAAEVAQNAEIRVAAIAEDARLDVIIAALGIVVEIGETLLCLVIDIDEVGELVAVRIQRATNLAGQVETGHAVLLALHAEHTVGHLLQTDDQRVVACNLVFGAFHECLERHALALELPILLGGLVTGVGQVEHVVLLLGVEHERVLVRPPHGGHQLVAQLFASFLVDGTAFSHLAIIVIQLGAQNLQRLGQVLLFQHGMGIQHSQQNDYNSKKSLHLRKILPQR